MGLRLFDDNNNTASSPVKGGKLRLFDKVTTKQEEPKQVPLSISPIYDPYAQYKPKPANIEAVQTSPVIRKVAAKPFYGNINLTPEEKTFYSKHPTLNFLDNNAVKQFIDTTSNAVSIGLSGYPQVNTKTTGNETQDTAANILGSILSYAAPVGATGESLMTIGNKIGDKVVARLPQAFNKNIITRIVKSGIQNAAATAPISVLEGAAQGKSPIDIAKKVGVEAVAGAGLGIAGHALGAILSKFKAKIPLTVTEKDIVTKTPELFQLPGMKQHLMLEAPKLRTPNVIEGLPPKPTTAELNALKKPVKMVNESTSMGNQGNLLLSGKQPLQLKAGVKTDFYVNPYGVADTKPVNQLQLPAAKPETYYHGSSKDFSEFDTNYQPMFFTKSKEYATSYASKVNKNGIVYDVSLDVKKPFDTRNKSDLTIFNNDFVQYASERFGKTVKPLREGEPVSFIDADLLYPFLRKMKREGKYNYDGILVDEKNMYGESVVPLDKSQISILNKAKPEATKVLPQDNFIPQQIPVNQLQLPAAKSVLNESGQPLTVYHGTNAKQPFTEFKGKYTKNNQMGFGIHFTPDENFAKLYADKPTGKTIKANITANKILNADAIYKEGTPEFNLAKKLNPKAYTPKDENGIPGLYLQNVIDATSPQRAERIIREAGYDAVKYNSNRVGTLNPAYNTRTQGEKAISYIVFNNSQIKQITSGVPNIAPIRQIERPFAVTKGEAKSIEPGKGQKKTYQIPQNITKQSDTIPRYQSAVGRIEDINKGAPKQILPKFKPNKIPDAADLQLKTELAAKKAQYDEAIKNIGYNVPEQYKKETPFTVARSTVPPKVQSQFARERVGTPQGTTRVPTGNGNAIIPDVGLGGQGGVNPIAQDGKSKFAQTVADSKNTVPQLSKDLKDLDLGYDVATNKRSLEQANSRIADNPEAAVRFVLDTKVPSAEHTTTAIQLINKFQNEGNFERAVDIASDISSKLTKNGQAIQAASIYDRLSPEGILLYAQRRVNKLNDERWLKGLTKEQKINPELAKQLKELAEKIKTLTGDAKVEASQELQQALQALGKSTVFRKLESAQTIAQLLNPKTIIARNPLGNELFYRLERFNKYVATPIDMARSTLTGAKRTITFKTGGQGGYWEGFFKGVKAGWKGVNPAGLTTQFDLTAPAFSGRWNPLTYMEKALGATLKGFDYASYSRALNQTIGEMAELKAINTGLSGTARKTAVQEFIKNTDKNILDIADQYGKYVTFQDDNVLSKGLSAVKRGLNLGKEFGLGSLVIKYPRTPGALIMRALDYSAAGFLKSAYEIAKPLLKGGKIDTREATMALSRAITGTLGFTGLGYYLAENGVITGRTDKDKDVRDLQKQTGAGSYKVNLSALKRWATSGFDTSTVKMQDGDTLYSYDWAQPIAMAISFGANINQNIKDNKGMMNNFGATAAASLEGALGTITEQPVLQGITRLFQGYDLGQNVTQTLKSIPSSFTSTLGNQARQLGDNTGRSTYDPSPVKESLNMAKVKIPVASGKLPVAYDTLGKQRENFQNGSNNFFNVFLNPGFISKNAPTPVQKEILRLYKTTSDKTQFPQVADKKFNWKDNNFILSAKEYSDFQRTLGQETLKLYEQYMQTPEYQTLPDEEKAKKLSGLISDAKDKAKFGIIKGRGISSNPLIMDVPSSLEDNKKTIPLTFDQQKELADNIDKLKKLYKSYNKGISEERALKAAKDRAYAEMKVKLFNKKMPISNR